MPLPFPPSPNTGSVVDIVVPNLTKSSAHVAMLLPWTVNRMFRIHLQCLVRYSPRLWTYFRQLWRVPWVTLLVCAHDSCPQTNSKEKKYDYLYLLVPSCHTPTPFLPSYPSRHPPSPTVTHDLSFPPHLSSLYTTYQVSTSTIYQTPHTTTQATTATTTGAVSRPTHLFHWLNPFPAPWHVVLELGHSWRLKISIQFLQKLVHTLWKLLVRAYCCGHHQRTTLCVPERVLIWDNGELDGILSLN